MEAYYNEEFIVFFVSLLYIFLYIINISKFKLLLEYIVPIVEQTDLVLTHHNALNPIGERGRIHEYMNTSIDDYKYLHSHYEKYIIPLTTLLHT